MKIIWSSNHESITLIAETRVEVAFGEILVEGLNAHKYASSKTSAKWTIIPDGPVEEKK